MKKYGYIYITENLINGYCYIGQSTRTVDNYLKNYYGSGRYFIRVLKKYNKKNFKKTVLTWCDNQEELDLMEQYFITLKPEYNIENGGNGKGKVSEETKGKISESKKGKVSPRKGVKLLDETKEKIRKANLGKTASEETKRKMSKSAKKNIHTEEHNKNVSKSLKIYWKNKNNEIQGVV